MTVRSILAAAAVVAGFTASAAAQEGRTFEAWGAARHPQDWEAGNKIQREMGLERVPPVSECESGAGLWVRIRRWLVG